ncbi:ferredoxin--NADP reductase [Actinomadura fibrosa]|uniref:2Fe-2S iron-sulfur cluster-binding protein n=1 Tax=Actinomadura fibrosa TaxID=111802 RepID=A0ABW2XWC6_9ACTN|nr:ferredoxin--NADP reductase [Actinomadura fibrosa]
MAHDHGFHPVRITRVIDETADARTYALDAAFGYRAGQFLTFRACGTLRSYSMSSSPDTDTELRTTVKRVPGGLVSNWMLDNLGPGDIVEVTRPAGTFCLRETPVPLVAFCGGSGITPIASLVKSALATTDRRVRVLAADRHADAVIFGDELAELAGRHPGRFEIERHLDAERGFVTDDRIRGFVGADQDADFYICGPAPFMDLVERTLLSLGVDEGQVFIERFTPADGEAAPAGPEKEGTVTIVLGGKRKTVPQRAGETLLQSARRAGLVPPFSCEAGNCATCMAQVTEGDVKMRVNNALEDDEVTEGWVLTCQGEPTTEHVTVVYED